MKARYLKIGWIAGAGTAYLRGDVTADIGQDVDPPTAKEMQDLMLAMKGEFWKLIRRRKKKR